MMLILLSIFLHALFPHFILAISSSNSGNGALKMVEAKVPPYRIPGDSALLRCDYDLGNDTLYSVKWYKEHEEFYRFVPKAIPQASWYAVEGVNVDMSKSNNKEVVLDAVTWKSSGVYRCEVSAEAPSFASAQSEGRMEVIAFPKDDPVISGTGTQYQTGDEIMLNCTSGKSHPPPALHWYINEQQVVNPEALVHYAPVYHQEGLYSTTLGLKLTLNNRHFHGSSMKVKCVAFLTLSWSRGYQGAAVQSLPIKDIREALLLVTVKSSSTVHLYSTALYFFIALLTFLQISM